MQETFKNSNKSKLDKNKLDVDSVKTVDSTCHNKQHRAMHNQPFANQRSQQQWSNPMTHRQKLSFSKQREPTTTKLPKYQTNQDRVTSNQPWQNYNNYDSAFTTPIKQKK